MFTWMFICGLLVVLTAVTLLLLNVVESGVAAAIGILGIGLIAASGRSQLKNCSEHTWAGQHDSN